jgi:glycine/D-amino acid oxidase-like deaminating enzyme
VGESRIFRTAYEGPQYVPALLRAQVLWRELEAEARHDLLWLNGGLMIGDADTEETRNVLASAEDFDLPHAVLDAAAMAARYLQHWPLLSGEVAILDHQAGVIRPARCRPPRPQRRPADCGSHRRRGWAIHVRPDSGSRPTTDGHTLDGHVLVGPVPGVPNVWLLGGFSGHGFKLSPAIGQLTTDLIREGETDLPIAHLDPARYLTPMAV